MPFNPQAMELINMIKNGNPQEIVMNMLRDNVSNGNPVVANLINLIQTGDTQEIENVVRNIAKERGIDFDKEFNSFKQMFGL